MQPTLWTNTRIVTCDGGVERALAPSALQVETADGRITAPGLHFRREKWKAADRGGRRLRQLRPVRIVTARLAANPRPAEYTDRAAEAGPAAGMNAFCERIAFTPAVPEPFFSLGLPVRLHAEQPPRSGAAALAARRSGLPADHPEHTTPDDTRLMAQPGTVAALLPGAFCKLRKILPTLIAAFRAAGMPMALATDCTPGTSPLNPINRGARLCRLALWNAKTPAQLMARIGVDPLCARIFWGEQP